MEWTTAKVRQTFLDYFRSKGHDVVDSAPIVIKDDPTLMFTNAGMNQFKSIFVGNEVPAHPRVADTQKCLRVSGKHNDLEEVGRDHYHHTMFEMLGNWSFGDYFKEEAIDMAWDLLINVYGLNPEDLYVTVFGGDDAMGVAADDEARSFWRKYVPEERILSFGRKDNFWEMGETGPCGPCSEIHIDLRPVLERKKIAGSALVNQDDPSVIEIWNLVFMQFNHHENGSLSALNEKHIDTGMGLERLVRVLQAKDSNYETDVLRGLIRKAEDLTGKVYGGTESTADVAFRVIADHVRAITFCIADGQLPGNTGAGYVVRRVLRRAIRYGFSQLDMKRPFIFGVANELINLMGEDFPELRRGMDLILRVVKEEEMSFLSTLEKGLDRLAHVFEGGENKEVGGSIAFELYDTFGFPIDLTRLIAEEHGWQVDMDGFHAELEQQKQRSRVATKTSFGDWTVLQIGPNSRFLGYSQLSSEVEVAKYRIATVKGKEVAQLVLNQTPFYAESGGQVGDKGVLEFDGEKVKVVDTKKENNEIIHIVNKLPKTLSKPGEARVDRGLRNETRKNHTATHLLHHALRDTLGSHVEQKGSLVAPDRLRFDFSHFEKVSDEVLEQIEAEVRDMVTSDLSAEIKEMPLAEAKELGAMALFGEKYGDRVRVVKFGPSIELCGGTHVERSSEIGGFKLISEASVASGIRRIEALTGQGYQNYVDQRLEKLSEIEEALGQPKDPVAAVSKLQSDLKQAQKLVDEMVGREKGQLKKDLSAQVKAVGPIHGLVAEVSGLEGKAVKDTVYGLTLEQDDLLAMVVGSEGDKPYIVVGLSKALAESGSFDASKIVRELAGYISGGGGGQKFLAMAGGKNKEGLRGALAEAEKILADQAN